MANARIRGMDDELYARIKERAAAEDRSVSQPLVHLVKGYLPPGGGGGTSETPARILMKIRVPGVMNVPPVRS